MCIHHQSDDQCCNSCEEVRDAYRKKGWSVTNVELIDQVLCALLILASLECSTIMSIQMGLNSWRNPYVQHLSWCMISPWVLSCVIWYIWSFFPKWIVSTIIRNIEQALCVRVWADLLILIYAIYVCVSVSSFFLGERAWARVSLRGLFLYHLTNYCEATISWWYIHYMFVLLARILNNRNYDSHPYWLTIRLLIF